MRKYACLYLFFHFDSILNNFQDIDVLVKWDADGSKNVVSRKDIQLLDGQTLFIGCRVEMWWGPEKAYYKGRVEAFENSDEEIVEEDEEENIPLSIYVRPRVCSKDRITLL